MNTSKTILTGAIAILSLAIAIGTPTLYGQMSTGVEAHIPFEFTVGKTTLPAGDYVFRSGPYPAILEVQGPHGSRSAMIVSHATQNRANVGERKVVFIRYGESHFLSEVWAGNSTGRQLSQRRLEGLLAQDVPTRKVQIAAK